MGTSNHLLNSHFDILLFNLGLSHHPGQVSAPCSSFAEASFKRSPKEEISIWPGDSSSALALRSKVSVVHRM
jgi:hypothetical protein